MKIKVIANCPVFVHGSFKIVVGVLQLNCHPVVSLCGIFAYIKKSLCNTC